LYVGSGPPTPPPLRPNSNIPQDAPNVNDLQTYLDYLKKMDEIIEANMRSYDFLTEHNELFLPVLPMEPCIVTEGLTNHIRFQQSLLDKLGNYPAGIEHGIPEIVRDDELLRIIGNYEFANLPPHHLYVSQDKCSEQGVEQFNAQLILTAQRFRLSIERLISTRRTLSEMTNIFGGEKIVRQKLNQKFAGEPIDISQEFQFAFKNKLDLEEKVQNFHFAIEALRSQLLKMLDEMFARRMGWGYWMQNPGHKFLVFIRHTPLVQSYIWPNKTQDIKKERFNRETLETEQIIKKSFNCIVKVSSINQLTEIMSKETGLDFQIFHFVEEEEKLKLLIENLQDVYNSWDRVSHGYFYTNYYNHLYDVVYNMFEVFKKDVLLNPKYANIEKKTKIILEFKKLILNELNYNIAWYWDPTGSAYRIQSYINTIYGHQYPKKPPEEVTPFHSEL